MKRAVDEVLPADLKAVPFPIVLFLFAVIIIITIYVYKYIVLY